MTESKDPWVRDYEKQEDELKIRPADEELQWDDESSSWVTTKDDKPSADIDHHKFRL